ncbi:MAG: hypothetical protein RL708_1263 [Bacteroidota bacterium]|jgi:uncharacterized lipoprotein YehR (DUF1307 family)
MKRFYSFIAVVLVLSGMLFLLNGCKKKDWRDSYVGSFTGWSRYQKRSTNYVTGQAYSYVGDTIIKKSVNINIVINDKSDQLTFRIDNNYICDADKDGYTNKATYTAKFTADSVFVIESLPADTFFFGRIVYAAKRI